MSTRCHDETNFSIRFRSGPFSGGHRGVAAKVAHCTGGREPIPTQPPILALSIFVLLFDVGCSCTCKREHRGICSSATARGAAALHVMGFATAASISNSNTPQGSQLSRAGRVAWAMRADAAAPAGSGLCEGSKKHNSRCRFCACRSGRGSSEAGWGILGWIRINALAGRWVMATAHIALGRADVICITCCITSVVSGASGSCNVIWSSPVVHTSTTYRKAQGCSLYEIRGLTLRV